MMRVLVQNQEGKHGSEQDGAEPIALLAFEAYAKGRSYQFRPAQGGARVSHPVDQRDRDTDKRTAAVAESTGILNSGVDIVKIKWTTVNMLGSLVLLIESLVQCLLNANEKGSERLQPLQVVFAPVLPAFQRAKLLKIAMEQYLRRERHASETHSIVGNHPAAVHHCSAVSLSHGLKISIPRPAKSLTLRVVTVRPCSRAVAPIRPSIVASGVPRCCIRADSTAQRSATACVTGSSRVSKEIGR